MKRGDIVIVSAAGDYGKPRPAVVIQSDRLRSMDSVLVNLMGKHESGSTQHYCSTMRKSQVCGNCAILFEEKLK